MTSRRALSFLSLEIPSRLLRTARRSEGMTGRVVAEGGGVRFLPGHCALYSAAKEGGVRMWRQKEGRSETLRPADGCGWGG
jgi:hypothetical protein